MRQRGTEHHAGSNVGLGKDYTLFALVDGYVFFQKKRNNRSYVSVLTKEEYKQAMADMKTKKE